MNDRELTLFDKAIIFSIPFTLILSVILFFVTKNNNAEIKSLVIGATVSIVLNYGNYKLTFKIQQENVTKLKLFVPLSYVIRFVILGTIIFVACFFADYNVIYIIFGVLEYPVFLIIMGLLESRGGAKND